MKYAASIRYGGQLVDADDCDYSDYKDLQLLCPECKEPVYLQKSSIRNLVYKQTDIPAHFKHFSCTRAELVKQCESRVKHYDQKETDRRRTQARNQRLKVLQSRFWKIFLNNVLTLNGEYSDAVTSDYMQERISDFLEDSRIITINSSNFNFSKEEAYNFYQEYIAGKNLVWESTQVLKVCMLEDLHDYMSLEISVNVDNQSRRMFSSKANTDLAMCILKEIIDFVCAKSSLCLLWNCIAFGILECNYSPRAIWLKERLIDEVPLGRAGASIFVKYLVKIDWSKALADPDRYSQGNVRKELLFL